MGKRREARGDIKMPLAKELLLPLAKDEQRKHKLKRLVQHPNSYFMDVKCPGCYRITTVFSHAQTVVVCSGCSTVPTWTSIRTLQDKVDHFQSVLFENQEVMREMMKANLSQLMKVLDQAKQGAKPTQQQVAKQNHNNRPTLYV